MPSNAILIAKHIDKSLNRQAKRSFTNAYGDHQLSISLSLDRFAINVLDIERNKHLALMAYALQEITDYDSLVKEIDILFAENELLKRYYPHVKLLFETPKSTLVPAALFDRSVLDQYLRFNHIIDRDDEIVYDKLTNLKSFNVFALPRTLNEKLREKFARFKIVHYASSLIESLLIATKNQLVKNTVFVNVRNYFFDIVYIEDEKLVFYNSFQYRTPEDFAYFLIFSIEQLKLNPENVIMIFMGDISKNSKLYEIAFKYIRNIEFINRNVFFSYSYVFDDIPDNYYYNLLNISQCEL